MSTTLSQTLDSLDLCLADLSATLSSLTTTHPNFDLFANSSNSTRESNAKTNLTLAFALNSLFYSTLRLAQTERAADIKAHPVHAQIKIVRDHYVKVDSVFNSSGN